MPIVTQCPSCNRQLRVPDNLLGRSVRCPGCKETFTASAGPGPSAAQPLPPEEDEPRRAGQVRHAQPKADYEEEVPQRRQRPAPPEHDDDLDDSPDDYPEEDADYEPSPRKRRRKRSRSVARAAVAAPAIYLMIVAGLAIGYALFSLGLYLRGFEMVPAWLQDKKAGPPNQAEQVGRAVGFVIGFSFVIGWWIVVFFGALKMKKLQSHGLAVTSSILAMIPCGGLCCLFGLPLGIWSLVVLNRPEVKDAF